MKHSYLLAAGLLLFCACGKDDDIPGLSGEYKADNRILATAINMYTSNGQVNNPTLVDNFIRRHHNDSYFSRTDAPFFAGYSLTLSISSDNKATLISTADDDPQNPYYTLKTEILSRSQDHLVLAELDSVWGSTSAQANRCEQLSQSMVQVQPNERCFSLPLSGSSKLCRYRPVSVLLIKDGGLRLPLFSWLIINQQGGISRCGNAYSNVRNMFNTAVLNQLRAGDTIVVQVREVPFIKQ